MMSILPRLHALGYRRPGLVLQTKHNLRLQNRWAAAFHSYQQYDVPFEAAPSLVIPEITRAEFVRWFKKTAPDVVLSHRAETMTWMEECGAKIPATHGFCALNTKLLNVPCAGIDQQPSQIGARSIELIIAQIHRNEYGIPELPCNTTVPSRWIDGPTLRSALA